MIVNFHLTAFQASLNRPHPQIADNIGTLRSSIMDARNYHKLYELDIDRVNSFVGWATNNLEKNEIMHLTRRINYQKDYYRHWNSFGIANAEKFLTKTSDSCFCDPFTPEPKLYDGHISFSPDAEKDASHLELGYSELSSGYSSSKCWIGEVRFNLDLKRSIIEVKMKRKNWSSFKKRYPVLPGKMERFKLLLGFLSTREVIPVNPERQPIGRIWHAYSIREIIDKANSDQRMFYQMNSQKVVVAGSKGSSEFKMWCV